MEENIIFEYPIFESTSGMTEEIELCKLRTQKRKKGNRILAFIVAFVCLFFYILSIWWDIFFAVSIISVVILLCVLRSSDSLTEQYDNLLYIQATDKQMYIESINAISDLQVICNIDFTDIAVATISKDLQTVFITFNMNKNSQKEVSKQGMIIDDTFPNSITIKLNEYSYQQFFFLYIAPKYFNLKISGKNSLDKIVLNKYGEPDTYLAQLEKYQNT